MAEVFPEQSDINLDDAYLDRLEKQRIEALNERARRIMRAQPQPDATPAPAAPAEVDAGAGAEEESTFRKIQRQVSPTEFLGGALDALDENFNTLRLVSESGNKFLMETLGVPGLIIGDDGWKLSTDFGEFSQTDDIGGLLPDMGDKERGSFARGIGQFAANYIALGKAFKAMGVMQGAGRFASGANSAVRSALATASGFEAMDNPVNAIVQTFPSLEGQISEFMASDEEDPELLNKLRIGMIDMGAGAVVDTSIGMLRGLRRMSKQSKQIMSAADQAENIRLEMDEVRDNFRQIIGDADDERLIIPAAERVADQAPAPAAVTDAASDIAAAAEPPTAAIAPDDEGVFINWARIESSDDVKSVIQELADADAPAINEARRGVRTNVETALSADELNAWDILEGRRKGEPLNAEQSLAVRRLWTASGRKVLDLARSVQAGGGVAEKTAFRKMLAVHSTIQEQVIAARTETARALQSWRIPAGEIGDFTSVVDDLRVRTELDVTTERLAEGILTLSANGSPKQVDDFIYASGRLGMLSKAAQKGADMVTQLYYASMLSGLHTQARNIIGNTGMMGLNVAERRLASSIGRFFDDEQVARGEAGAMMFGMVQGARDAFRISAKSRAVAEAEGRVAGGFIDALRSGDSGFGIGKVETGSIGAFSAEKLRLDPQSGWGRAANWIDVGTQVPQRLLGAFDEVFKTANFRAEVMAQAHRKAQDELKRGLISKVDFPDRITELINNPDEYVKVASRQQAEMATFTRRPNDTSTWQAMRAVSRIPVLGKLVLPFSRTPYNIAVESIERLPIAPLSQKWRQDMMAGGARADIAMAKMGLGSMFLAVSADLAAQGYLSGDMSGLSVSGAERELKSRLGERPMTLRVPLGENGETRTFSFRGLDPLTFSLGIAANTVEILSDDDFSDADKDYEDVATAAMLAIGAQFVSANYMSGAADFFDAMSDPKRYGENYFERLGSVVVPQAVAQVSRQMDPTVREANTMWEAVIAKTPYSVGLEPRMDALGQELRRESGLGKTYDFLSPIYSSKEEVQPISREEQRLGIAIGKPNRRISIDGITINLKKFPHIYTEYQRLQGQTMTATVDGAPVIVNSIGYVSTGQPMMEELNAIVEGRHPFSPIYQMGTDGTDGDKANFLQLIVREHRKEARRHLVDMFPELRSELQSRAGERQERVFGPQRLDMFGSF